MKRDLWFKLVSLLVSCQFMATTVVQAAPAVYAIKVAEDHGKVLQRYRGESEKTIIHIQDAHENLDAQMNVANIVRDIMQQDDSAVVGVEGAARELDMSSYRAFPFEDVKSAKG